MKKIGKNNVWLQKNRDWLITLTVFFFFVLLLSLSRFFFQNNNHEDTLKVEEKATFNIPQQNQSGPTDSEDPPREQPQSTTFYLRPGPDELLQKLEGLNYQEFKKETKNLPGLRVMWPAYFFSVVTVANNKAEVMLDASEDGFGVILVTEVDIKKYPEILKIKRGKKIWLAAEIAGVDPAGTGQILLTTEYVRFDDYQPQAQKKQANENN